MDAAPRLVVLTPRQRAVLGQLTRDGADNATIGARLGISEQTVKHHMKGILAAFGQSTRIGVVIDCLRGHVRVRVRDDSGTHWRKTDLQETA